MIELSLIAGTPSRLSNYNATGNSNRESLKILSIGKSAAKHRTGERSSTIQKWSTIHVNWKWEASCLTSL